MDFKKSVLTLLALGLSGVASAGGFMPAPACTNQPVTVPCEHSGWDFGLTAYWLRPSSNFTALLFGEQEFSPDFEEISSYRYSPKHRLGFGVEGSYHWGTGNDINVNWTRFHQDYDYRYLGVRLGPSAEASNTNIDVKFDELNFELGQMLMAGSKWDVRSHFGASFARIDIDTTSHIATGNSEGEARGRLVAGQYDIHRFHSQVKGVGPRAGFDLAYQITDQFSVVGHTAMSLIFGDRATEFVVTAGAPNNQYFNWGDRHSVMLGASGKLGLAYNTSMHGMNTMIEGGYTVMTYHDGIDLFGVFSSPFNLDGWFLKAKVTS